MSNEFVMFNALPQDCNAQLGKMVPEEETDKMRKAYCDECERRHAFVPNDDE